MFTFEYPYRVRYADVDQMGYMYYGNYPTLYEIGRVEALRSLGVSYKSMEDNGVMMPVYDCYSRYVQPIRYDELVTIRVTIKEIPKARIVFSYEILNEANKVVNQGNTTLVFVKMDTNRLTTCPASILDALSVYFE